MYIDGALLMSKSRNIALNILIDALLLLLITNIWYFASKITAQKCTIQTKKTRIMIIRGMCVVSCSFSKSQEWWSKNVQHTHFALLSFKSRIVSCIHLFLNTVTDCSRFSYILQNVHIPYSNRCTFTTFQIIAFMCAIRIRWMQTEMVLETFVVRALLVILFYKTFLEH